MNSTFVPICLYIAPVSGFPATAFYFLSDDSVLPVFAMPFTSFALHNSGQLILRTIKKIINKKIYYI